MAALIHLISGLAGRRHPPYSIYPDSVVARSVQNCRSAQRYTHAFCALVRTHFSLYIASPGSSRMGNWTLLPTTNGLRRKARTSRTGEWLSSKNLVAQSIRANTSMAALSAAASKNLREWTSGWCSTGSIWWYHSSRYIMGFSTIFLYFLSRFLWATSLAAMLPFG